MNHSIYSSSFLPNESESIPTYNGGYPSYSEYPHPSKLEAFDYNYWPATTTHNLLSSSNEAIVDQIPVSSSSSSSASSASNLPMESLVPISTVNLTQINTNNSISSTHHHHHHHHIHQHMYPPALVSATPPNCHDPSSWMATPADYPALHSNPVDPSHYRHYSTPCSAYSTQHFYDPTPSASQWPTAPLMPIKYESPYTPPSYFESSDSFHQPAPETPKKDEGQSDSSDQSHWLKPSSTSTPLSAIPPRNPLNGKTRTRDKYRIVYTDQQRCELENEFNNSHYISIPRKAALSVTLKLSERQIKIWFQNRRAKERKLNKRRSEASGSARPSNHSHDGDSQSEAGPESPHYYPHCSS